MTSPPSGLFDSVLTIFGGKAPYLLDTPNDALIVVIVANIWIGVPFFYLVIQSGLQTISPVLHEAALVDGCSWWKELTRITIPLFRETILTVLMLGIAGTMNVFALVWILTMGGPADATMLPGPLAYTQAFVVFNYGQGAAIILGVVAILLCVAGLFLLATRSESGGARHAKSSRARPCHPGRRTHDRDASGAIGGRGKRTQLDHKYDRSIASAPSLAQVGGPPSHPVRASGPDNHDDLPFVPDLLVGAGIPEP